MKLKELYRDEMPREKLLDKGAYSLSNAELLAIMLRSGTEKLNVVDLARELLRSGGGTLAGVAAMPQERLCAFCGIGPSKAAALLAAFELGRRSFAEHTHSSQSPVSTPRNAYNIMIPHLKSLDHEECWAIFLNRANCLIDKEMMSSGGLESTIIDCKTVVRRAIEKKASSVILVHNHPSGNALPGQADIKQTMMLKKALATCEICLTDHIIVADNCFYSFADELIEKV